MFLIEPSWWKIVNKRFEITDFNHRKSKRGWQDKKKGSERKPKNCRKVPPQAKKSGKKSKLSNEICKADKFFMYTQRKSKAKGCDQTVCCAHSLISWLNYICKDDQKERVTRNTTREQIFRICKWTNQESVINYQIQEGERYTTN